MKKDNIVYLEDIIESIEYIIDYTNEYKTEEELVRDQKTLDAVLRRIQVLGEAVKRLDIDFRNQYSDIPWKQMAGLRDVVVHDYDEIKIDRVWRVIQGRIPEVLPKLKKLL